MEAATACNRDSYEQRDRYASHLLIPLETIPNGHPMEHGVDTGRGSWGSAGPRLNEAVEEAFGPQSSFSGSGSCWASHIVNVGTRTASTTYRRSGRTGCSRREERGGQVRNFTATPAHTPPARRMRRPTGRGREMILSVRSAPRPGTGVVRPGGRSQEGPETGEGRGAAGPGQGRREKGAFELIGYLRSNRVNLLITSPRDCR